MNVIKNRKGVIFVVAYLIIGVLLILSAIYFSSTVSEKSLIQREKSFLVAFYIAEAGLERGMCWLRSQASPPTGTSSFDPFAGTQTLGDGSYAVTIDPDDSNPSNYLKRYRITSVGNVSGTTRQLVTDVQTETFARFSYFSDKEEMTLPDGDTLPN